MNLKLLITSVILICSVTVNAAGSHDLKPVHGGVIVEAKDVDIELVARVDSLSLYLTDHGKSLSVEGASAKVTILNGSDKKDYDLAPNGDKFELKGNFLIQKGAKAIAVIKLKSKVITARFNL